MATPALSLRHSDSKTHVTAKAQQASVMLFCLRQTILER